jgi:hypothetical protein
MQISGELGGIVPPNGGDERCVDHNLRWTLKVATLELKAPLLLPIRVGLGVMFSMPYEDF